MVDDLEIVHFASDSFQMKVTHYVIISSEGGLANCEAGAPEKDEGVGGHRNQGYSVVHLLL